MEKFNETFNTLSASSDQLTLYYINKQFSDCVVFNENDTNIYSVNDFLVTDSKTNVSYLIEGKVRSKKYDTIMLEEIKYNGLLDKLVEYRERGVNVMDAYYYNIIRTGDKTECYCYKLSDVVKKVRENDYYTSSTSTSATKLHIIYSDMIEAKKPVYTSTYCPTTTACNGNNTYKAKGIYYLPISMGEVIE